MPATVHSPVEPSLTDAPPRLVLYRRFESVAQADLPSTFATAFGELYAHIDRVGAAPAGPPFARYWSHTEAPVRWTLDVCALVSRPVTAHGELQFIELPASPVVKLLHVGPYDGLGAAYDAIERYVSEQGLVPAGPPCEFYLSEPDVPPEQVQTLIEQPVQRA